VSIKPRGFAAAISIVLQRPSSKEKRMMIQTLVTPISTSLGSMADDSFWNSRHEMDALSCRFLPDGDGNELRTGFIPALDLSQVDNTIEARMDIPGMKPEEIAVQVSGDVLVISGEREEDSRSIGKTFFWNERRVGLFSRSVHLPCPIVIDQVTAAYTAGVLTIRLPKVANEKTRRVNITVR
jgi:HSP20 family protein